MSKEMKTLNGYEVVDAKAREQIGKISIPEVPTKVSQLENDKNYATMGDIPSLDNYATKDEIPDLTDYATKSEIPSLDNYATIDDIPDVSAYQTAEQVNQLINIAIGDIENGTY